MSGDSYSSRNVSAIYNISHETVRNWAMEFAQYLSEGANPGGRRPRLFTPQDMEIMAVIAEMKRAGYTYEDIHTTLQSGARGIAPATTPEALEDLLSLKAARTLIEQNEALQAQTIQLAEEAESLRGRVRDLELELAKAETLAGLYEQSTERLKDVEKRADERVDRARRESREEVVSELKILREQVAELHSQIGTLREQLGSARAQLRQQRSGDENG